MTHPKGLAMNEDFQKLTPAQQTEVARQFHRELTHAVIDDMKRTGELRIIIVGPTRAEPPITDLLGRPLSDDELKFYGF